MSKPICVISRVGQTSEAESLFVYDTGSSHASFFDPSFKPLFELNVTDAAAVENVTRMCHGYRQCVFDYFVTGNAPLALATAEAIREHETFVKASEKGKRFVFLIACLLLTNRTNLTKYIK